MKVFHDLCPKLGDAETRSVILSGHASLPDGKYTLDEYYCTESDCDCRRVILSVVSHARSVHEATISFGFEQDDPMKGPFLDPLNKQGRHANSILEVVAGVLRKDPVYVARLVTHYQIAKAISSGRMKPEDATSSYRIPEFVGVDISEPPSRVGEHPMLKEKSVGEPESGDVFSKFFKMGWLAGSDRTFQEGFEEFGRKFPGASAYLDSPWEKSEFFSGGFNTSGRAERDAKKRQRQAKKRNRR